MNIDIVITGSSRPFLFKYCWQSFKKMVIYRGKKRIIFHEDFVFPEESNKTIKLLKEFGDFNIVIAHNPACGLGVALDDLIKNHIKADYVFYIQDDWEFERPIDLDELIYVMDENPEVNGIALSRFTIPSTMNGTTLPEYTYSGVDMCLLHRWVFMPGLWRMSHVKKYWKMRKHKPENFFTNQFGTHKQRCNNDYAKRVMGLYLYGKTGNYRMVRHLGNSWRMAEWQRVNGNPSGNVECEILNDRNFKAPWLPPLKQRPINKTSGIRDDHVLEELLQMPIEIQEQHKDVIKLYKDKLKKKEMLKSISTG